MKILLATDGSEHSERAARFLTRLNLSSDDKTTIFHAIYGIPCLYGREFYYDTLEAMKKEIAHSRTSTSKDVALIEKRNES